MHQMKVGGNLPGLLFAVGTALIFLVAIPALWYFVAAAVVVGIAVAVVLHTVHRFYPEEQERITIKL